MGKTRSTIFSRRKVVSDPKASKENERVDARKKSQSRPEFETVAPPDKEKSKSREKRAAKQKSENNRSLKRMKNRGLVRQMLESFPRDANSVSKPEADENYDVPAELYPGQIKSESDEVLEEDIYESRKLLIRQMQGQIAKEVAGSRTKEGTGSGYDSWSDLEENFALAYEPIPLNIKMDTWRRMSKIDILNTVRSVKMRKEFEYMSRSEILGKIEMMQKSAQYLSEKFGVNHLLPPFSPTDENPVKKEHHKLAKPTVVKAQVHHNHPIPATDVNGNNQDDADSVLTDFSAVIPPYVSRSEILKFYEDDPPPRPAGMPVPDKSSRHLSQMEQKIHKHGKQQHLSHQKEIHGSRKSLVPKHDSWSSRASSILNSKESIYMSRNELLQNIEDKKGEESRFQKQERIHDSWSSRASSILGRQTGEPPYMSRAELLGNIALFGLLQQHQEQEALIQRNNGRQSTSSSSGENDASVSTVKNVVLVRKRDLHTMEAQRVRPLNKKQEKEVSRLKYLSDSESQLNDEPHTEIVSCSNGYTSDTCSCEQSDIYSDCSCCGSDTATDSSADTVVDGYRKQQSGKIIVGAERDKGKRKDCYIVNGSDTSTRSSPMKSRPMILKPDPMDLLAKTKVRQMQLLKHRPESIHPDPADKSGKLIQRRSADSWSNSEFEKIFEPVQVDEIKRQRNSRALKRYLKGIASEWDNEINDMNTLRRNKVLKQLNSYLKENIDLGKIQTGDLGFHIEVALREALDAHFETMSNLNLGHMYVPMEDNPNNSKVVSRENTDYDTFGSIDSLIFEPKIPTHEDIKEVQEEIEHQFEYLDQIGMVESVYNDGSVKNLEDVIGPGKTTFAERVKLFQKLGKKEAEAEEQRMATPVQRPVKKITVLEVDGQETTWKELAKAKDSMNPRTMARNLNSGPVVGRLDEESPADDDGMSSSVCPECQHNEHSEGDESLLTSNACSTCDCCTECDLENHSDDEAPNENPYNFGTTTASWDFEKVPHNLRPPLKLLTKSSAGSTNEKLRNRLKEAFGIDLTGNITEGTLELSDQQSYYERLTYGSSSVERDVDHQEDFMLEYGKKHNLLKLLNFEEEDDEKQSKESTISALFLRNGKPINITEEMFRGDFFQNASFPNGPKFVKSNQQNSDLVDSGIGSPPDCHDPSTILEDQMSISQTNKPKAEFASPPQPPPMPAAPSQLNTILLHTKPNGSNNPPIKKRDTMIRELKSKLKEKFNISDSAMMNPESSDSLPRMDYQKVLNRDSLVPRLSRVFETRRVLIVPKKKDSGAQENLQDEEKAVMENLDESIEPSFILQNCENLTISRSPLVAVPMVVEITRQDSSLGVARNSPSGSSLSASTIKEKLSRKSESPKTSNRFEVGLDEPIQRAMTASPQETREVLYGPGGIFGPKGPFSTPNVRYPFGMEVGVAAHNIPKRFVHFDAKLVASSRSSRKSPGFASDLSSPAEDRSDKSHYVILNDTMQMPTGPTSPITSASCESKPSSRIDMYQSGWVDVARVTTPTPLPSARSSSPAKPTKWREEKNLRMLAWVNHSHPIDDEQDH